MCNVLRRNLLVKLMLDLRLNSFQIEQVVEPKLTNCVLEVGPVFYLLIGRFWLLFFLRWLEVEMVETGRWRKWCVDYHGPVGLELCRGGGGRERGWLGLEREGEGAAIIVGKFGHVMEH